MAGQTPVPGVSGAESGGGGWPSPSLPRRRPPGGRPRAGCATASRWRPRASGARPSRRPPSTTSGTSDAANACATSPASSITSGTVRHGPCSRQSRRSALLSGIPTTAAHPPVPEPSFVFMRRSRHEHLERARPAALEKLLQIGRPARGQTADRVELADGVVRSFGVGHDMEQARLRLHVTGPGGQAVAAHPRHGDQLAGVERAGECRALVRPDHARPRRALLLVAHVGAATRATRARARPARSGSTPTSA